MFFLSNFISYTYLTASDIVTFLTDSSQTFPPYIEQPLFQYVY